MVEKPMPASSLPPAPSKDAGWTVRRVLAWTREEFTRRGVDNPRLDSEVLLAHALHVTRMQLYLDLDKPLLPAELATYKALVKRRAAREPVSHILGQREFWGRPFHVTKDTLAPRPDTETVVDDVLTWAKGRPAPLRVLDVGTGTGCLAITLALELAGSVVTAVDLSPAALDVARVNTAALNAPVELLESDLLAALPSDARFDVVVSNPPYLTTPEWEAADPEVRQHEPLLALVGGDEDGLALHRRLAATLRDRVNPGGGIWAELGWKQGPAALALWQAAWPDATVTLLKDLEKRDRVVRVLLA